MSSLESALKNALQKGDASDPLFRRKVYEAAANAIEKSHASKSNAPQETLERQKSQLADTIRAIEAELKEGVPTVETPQTTQTEPISTEADIPAVSLSEAQVAPEPVSSPSPEVLPDTDEPVPVADTRLYVEPRNEAEPIPEPVTPKPKPKPVRRRAPFAMFLTGTIAICLLGMGLFWVITTGAFQSAEERDTSVPNPAQVLESENFEGRDPGTSTAPATLEAIQGNADGWVTLFTPADPAKIELVAGATASVESDPFGDFIRLTTPGEQSEVRIAVPLNLMAASAGRTMQIAIVARSDEGKPTQMSVTCDFGGAGDCGRVRFNVGQAENEFLFQVPMAGQSGSVPGVLILTTDVQNNGGAVKLLESRARLVEN